MPTPQTSRRTKAIPLRTRENIVRYYKKNKSTTYEEVADIFNVGVATVSRLLRRDRDNKGNLARSAHGGGRAILVDQDWLKKNMKAFPDDRLIDRIERYEEERGVLVGMGTMHRAVHRINYTYKKKHQEPKSKKEKM